MTLGDSRDDGGKGLKGVGGWLGFLCFGLFASPLILLVDIATNVPLLTSTLAKLVVIALDLSLAGFAIFTGVALVRIRHYAVRTAKVFFMINLVLGLFATLSVFQPSATVLDAFDGLRTLVVSAAWLAYLYRSERVRVTYAPAPAEKVSDVFA